MKGYKLWRIEPREARCFMSKDITFNETQMTMMCIDLEKGKEKKHVEVEPSAKGSHHLEALDD